MSADATDIAAGVVTALGTASAAWPDELWTGSVAWADAILRSYYGIYEFIDDPYCILRAGLTQARAPVLFSDGTDVAVGELIGTLHFWNEHLPRYSDRGPDLAWACAVRDRVHLFASGLLRLSRGRARLARYQGHSHGNCFAGPARGGANHACLPTLWI